MRGRRKKIHRQVVNNERYLANQRLSLEDIAGGRQAPTEGIVMMGEKYRGQTALK